MAVRANFEIGHESSLRTKQTPEGFTHDWEVFVRGHNNADISHFVDKVVFHLHETFTKPRRVLKEPPYKVKESGYAGFNLPIEIYLKNKDEPKIIKFTYDLSLQQSGPAVAKVMNERYIFQNPNEDFKKKLLRGGGLFISNHNTFFANPEQDNKSRDSFTDEKRQLVSKPKLSGDAPKKHRTKEEVPHRILSNFENLFGAPIQKPPKISPDPKKVMPPVVKTEKKDVKEKLSGEKDKQKSKHELKDKVEKVKEKEKDRVKEEKSIKSHNKEAERSKEKASKRPSERPPSPPPVKKKCLSPEKRPPSPPPRSSSANKEEKPPKIVEPPELKKTKVEEKPPEMKIDKEKKKKDKKDKDKDRSSKKEHKKEKERDKFYKEPLKESPKEVIKPKEEKPVKEKEVPKEPPAREKPPKQDKPFNKFSIENLVKTPQHVFSEETKQTKEKDSERKHKHKKKDKKRDESREKSKDSSKEKRHKHEKSATREPPPEPKPEPPPVENRRETPVMKMEPGSPISLDTASQCSSKSGIIKACLTAEDGNSSHSDSENSVAEEEMEIKRKIVEPPVEIKKESPPSPEPEPLPEPQPVPEPPAAGPSQKEKTKKHKDKSSKRDNDEKKRRKRKGVDGEEGTSRKIVKPDNVEVKDEERPEDEVNAGTSETKLQDNGVSSSLGEDAEPGDLSPEYMVQLRELQQRIMTIKSNEELERVVNLIAETGQYEVTPQTFDFDLCLLDRSTVQRLIQLVGC